MEYAEVCATDFQPVALCAMRYTIFKLTERDWLRHIPAVLLR